MKCYGGGFKKDDYVGHKTGKTILDVFCIPCKKQLDTLDAYEKHMMAKHPRRVRQFKKSGRWQQDRIDWRETKRWP